MKLANYDGSKDLMGGSSSMQGGSGAVGGSSGACEGGGCSRAVKGGGSSKGSNLSLTAAELAVLSAWAGRGPAAAAGAEAAVAARPDPGGGRARELVHLRLQGEARWGSRVVGFVFGGGGIWGGRGG